MKLYYKLLTFISAILATINTAYAIDANENNSPLCNIESILTDTKNILATNFKMIRHLSDTQEIQSYGKSFLTRDNGICWITEKPVKKLIYISHNNEVFNSYIDKSDLSNPMRNSGNNNNIMIRNLSQILYGNINQDSNSYNVNYDQNNGTIVLTPKDTNISKVLKNIVISLTENMINKIIILENTGNYTQIEFFETQIIEGNNVGIRELCHE